MVFNIQNNLTYSKSFIKIDIVKKMYKEIIKISDNIHNTINSIFKIKNTNLYEKKTSVYDGFVFHLYNSILNSTHEKTTSYLNINKDFKVSRQAYDKRSQLFNYNELKMINDNLFNKKSDKSIKESINYIDGTNINIYDKKSKHGYKNIDILGCTNFNDNSFLFTDNININNKKSEIKLFYNLINTNPFDKNEIIVVDRYYFSNKFINICNKKKIRFIARIKSNSSALDKFRNYLSDINKKYNYDPFNYKCNYNDSNIRIITFKSNNNYVHLATNILNKSKNIDYFKKHYKDRWNVEIYFKHIKKNSSMNKITSHKLKTVNNIILASSINQLIIDRILSIYDKLNDNQNKKINIIVIKYYFVFQNNILCVIVFKISKVF
jgi:hypothetical protein